jgi:nitrogen fixation NifU-like protein
MVLDVSFVAVGCAVVKSTASLMTTLVKGTGIHEIQQMTKDFQEFLADTSGAPVVANWLEPFKALQGYPVRARCALLPWVTLNRALSETELSD